MTRPRALRLAFAAVVASVLLAAAGRPVSAVPPASAALFHTRLLKSTPAKDTTLTGSPAAIQLWFSEDVELSVSRIQLLGADQKPVPLATLTRDDRKSEASLVGRLVTDLPAGGYTVNWTAASADGHAVKGSFGFTVRAR